MLRKAVVVACLAGAAAMALSSSLTAETFARTNYITFSKPVRLPGVALGSGTYIFELPDPISAWDVVTVKSADRKRVYYTGLTRAVVRPFDMPKTQIVSLAEARPDAAVPVRIWWPIGEQMGREFNYDGRP
jgi:hypothetical protein